LKTFHHGERIAFVEFQRQVCNKEFYHRLRIGITGFDGVSFFSPLASYQKSLNNSSYWPRFKPFFRLVHTLQRISWRKSKAILNRCMHSNNSPFVFINIFSDIQENASTLNKAPYSLTTGAIPLMDS
jgi:hypothetical protein